MRAADLATASILVLLGGIVVFDSLRIGIGWGTDGPRAGFFPFWLGVILILASVTIGAQAWRRATDKPFVTRAQLDPVLKVLWPATLMVVLITPVGLYAAAALYLGFYMRWVGRHGWVAVILCAIGVPVVTFAVFEMWFLVPMPKGPLESWLGY
jgi:hypothetical protein